MLTIYANAIRNATRIGPVRPNRAPAKTESAKRWLPEGHWWLRPERCIDETRT